MMMMMMIIVRIIKYMQTIWGFFCPRTPDDTGGHFTHVSKSICYVMLILFELPAYRKASMISKIESSLAPFGITGTNGILKNLII